MKSTERSAMSVSVGTVRVLFAAVLLGGCVTAWSCRGDRQGLDVEYIYPLEREVALLNTAAYPEGSYGVAAGDTLWGVAAKLNVDVEMLATANGLSTGSKLAAGDILVVPRVTPRGDNLIISPSAGPAANGAPEGPQEIPGVGPLQRKKPLVGPDGLLRAIAGGTVTGVFRRYTSLGDVVIIENDKKRIVYSGGFKPVTAKGCTVKAGDIIASGANPKNVQARVFAK